MAPRACRRAPTAARECRGGGRPRSRRRGRRARARARLGSSSSPSRLARSTMFSATIVGRPSSISCSAEAQVVVEVRCIDDDHQRVGLALALLLAEQDVARDRFVGAGRLEAVGAGQIDHLDRPAVGQRQPARMALDRHAGIIADFLAGAGQRVEQRALAGIGAAGDGDEREGIHRIAAGRGSRPRAGGGSRRSSGRRGSRSDRGRTDRGAAARP